MDVARISLLGELCDICLLIEFGGQASLRFKKMNGWLLLFRGYAVESLGVIDLIFYDSFTHSFMFISVNTNLDIHESTVIHMD